MQPDQLVQFVQVQLEDIKARDIVTINVGERASFTDYMVICSGNSSRHVRSIAQHINKEAKARDLPILGMEGTDVGEWGLIDLDDVIVHVMTDETRDTYQLEKLWAAED